MNFETRSLGSDLSDRDTMTRIVFGGISDLPSGADKMASLSDHWAVAIEPNGVDIDTFDGWFRQTVQELEASGIDDVVVSKSDNRAEERWFMFGNLERLIEAAKAGEVFVPIGDTYILFTLLDKLEECKLEFGRE